ncbi:hypothetical protein [Pseudomonas sp. EMN2]|uniref:hypothetical protein n=1 Tax=Pseudomonas sp. EMN2 TaxID=2615212 RepID=UPI00129B95BF|nr:hypothetical protein [Pseudomonas sp. EMN2]
MAITVVCITLADGGPSPRTILIKDTSAENLIMVADRFMSLYNEHARVNGDAFVELKCYVDDREVPMLTLVEQASSAYAAVRRKVFGDKGFVVVKHEVSVRHFIAQISSGKGMLDQAPPKWVGLVVPPKQAKARLELSLPTQDPVQAINTPTVAESLAPESEPIVEPANDASDARPRRMRPGNLGKLGC